MVSLFQKELFKAQLVLITGGSRGLGLALAREFLKNEARVILVARDQDELSRAAKLLRERFPLGEIFLEVCDVTQSKQVLEMKMRIERKYGVVSTLVNNAGAILVSPYDSLTEEDFRAQMELHLFAVIRLCRIFVDHFKRNKISGRIINICSLGGKIAVPHMLTYDTSKFALAGFSQGLTSELAQEGISVTTVYPTVMRTGSPIQAVFKGNHEKECAWFSTIDVLPGVSLSAEKAAHRIVKAALKRKTELIPSFAAKLRLVAGVLFPETMTQVMNFVPRLLPKEQSQTYRTGAQSQERFRRSRVYRIFKKRIDTDEVHLNQRLKVDPLYNLGLRQD